MHKPIATYTAVIVGVVVAAAFAVPALAGGKTGGGGTSSITLNGSASYGSPASFTVVDPPVKGSPEMSVQCSQNGQQVYLDVQMMSGTSPYAPTFTLSSAQWAANGGGTADCVANLYYYTWKGGYQTGVVYLTAPYAFTASG